MNHGQLNDITGYILAGGKSSRLGLDKRTLMIGQTTLLERVCELIKATLGNDPILVGDNLSEVARLDYRVINDKVPDRGPMGGLVAVLEDCATSWALVLAVDLPNLTLRELMKLATASRDGLDLLTLTKSVMPEPLVALYNTSTLPFWQKSLRTGNLSISAGISKLNWEGILLPSYSVALQNINTLHDLHAANAV